MSVKRKQKHYQRNSTIYKLYNMSKSIKPKLKDNENVYEFEFDKPLQNYRFVVHTEYVNREDMDDLIIQVFKKSDLETPVASYYYAEKVLDQQNKTFASFTVPRDFNEEPPFIIRIGPSTPDIDVEDFKFNLEAKSIVVS
jgi:hypothetical protein